MMMMMMMMIIRAKLRYRQCPTAWNSAKY